MSGGSAPVDAGAIVLVACTDTFVIEAVEGCKAIEQAVLAVKWRVMLVLFTKIPRDEQGAGSVWAPGYARAMLSP